MIEINYYGKSTPEKRDEYYKSIRDNAIKVRKIIEKDSKLLLKMNFINFYESDEMRVWNDRLSGIIDDDE